MVGVATYHINYVTNSRADSNKLAHHFLHPTVKSGGLGFAYERRHPGVAEPKFEPSSSSPSPPQTQPSQFSALSGRGELQ